MALNALNLPEGVEDGDDPTELFCDGERYGRLGPGAQLSSPVSNGLARGLYTLSDGDYRSAPGGTRAVRHALMGIGPGLKEGTPPYRPCTSLKFMYCDLTVRPMPDGRFDPCRRRTSDSDAYSRQDPGIGHVAELMKPSTAALLEIESVSIVGENNLTRRVGIAQNFGRGVLHLT